MPSADAHLHLFANGFAGALGMSPAGRDELEAYESFRQSHGIGRGLVVGYEGEPRYAGNNDYVLALAAGRSWIVPVMYIPVSPPPTAQQLIDFRARGAAGFAVYLPDAEHGRAFSSWPVATLDELSSQSAILSFNACQPAVAGIARCVDRLRGCQVLISHLGLPGRVPSAPPVSVARERLAPLLTLADREDVSVKLSALYTISDPPHDFPHASAQPFVDVLLDEFGPSRLVWGSDFSPALDFVSFSQLADSRILTSCSPAEVDDVMGRNLLRIVNDHGKGA
jgi:predicted TIM-barrel fold metal-dependent hydrolase